MLTPKQYVARHYPDISVGYFAHPSFVDEEELAGFKGPLHECTFYGNKEAGQKYWAMLSKGASQPWQATLKELTGSDKLDAGPMIEYFSPVNAWLKQQNEGQMCGWQASAAPAAAAK